MPKGGQRGVARHNYATRRLYDKKFPENREFRGVDGEGGNVPEDSVLFGERHQYLSLRVGPDLLETGKPLTWEDCFAFLADQSHSYIYVAYFFDYDVTMMIRTLPEEIAKKLLNRVSRTDFLTGQVFPVTYGGFDFEYLQHKEFKVRRHGTKKWIVINDVGPFFQTTFLNTLRRWDIGTEEERQFIEWGKAKRATFGAHDAETEAYNALEVLLLEQLMTNFRAVCVETGYVPKKWQGPGHLASAMLTVHGIPKRDEIPILTNGDFRSLAQAAYYGGRFETTAFGPIPGPVYQYDINGAYVHMLKSLPCLIHGTWRWIRERPDNSRLWFGQVHFDHSPGRMLYNLPFRLKNGNIQYPKEGNGVYWSVELDAAERCGTVFTFDSGWVYEAHCNCRWFDFVDSYYAQRLALGKSAKGYVLKLAGNSIYGKLAQSIGYAPWANPIWASLITAGCRALLIDAYSQDPSGCYMLATDGLFMGSKLNLPVSRELGEWEETIHPDGIFIVQPGVYFTGEDAKTRGVEKGKIANMRPQFDAAFEELLHDPWGNDHPVPVTVTNFITARLALMRNKWELAGTWETMEREISFLAFSDKRKHGYAKWLEISREITPLHNPPKDEHDYMLVTKEAFRTFPREGGRHEHSLSYGRIIGGGIVVSEEARYDTEALREGQRMADQPDWVQPMLSDQDH
jgi:hypothetical protein